MLKQKKKAFVLPQSQNEVKMRSHNTQRKCTVMTQCYKEWASCHTTVSSMCLCLESLSYERKLNDVGLKLLHNMSYRLLCDEDWQKGSEHFRQLKTIQLKLKSLILSFSQFFFPPNTKAVSHYQVRKVRSCVLGSSDFASSTRTGGHKSSNSANGTAAYLITSVSSPKLSPLYYNTTKYDIKHHCLFLFSCKHINSRKNVVQGTYIHYSENKYYIKQRCLFSVSFKILIATKMWFMQGVQALQ